MGKGIRIAHLAVLAAVVLFTFSCGPEKKEERMVDQPSQPQVVHPDFNQDSAFAFVETQVGFGPRVPGTEAHARCAGFMVTKMGEWCDTAFIQTAQLTTFDGTKVPMKNIIASFNPASKNRILFFAHWDTRPWADQDTAGTREANDGADDGASGVGVLMELARTISMKRVETGIDFIFFDVEDWGESGGNNPDSYALGTQYWTANPHVPGYTASYGILLDMVGAKNARFMKEGHSREYAGFVIDKVWKTAAKLGYSDYFIFSDGGYVTDDHVYVNRYGIPSIDIINHDPSSRSGFVKHWHTHQDKLEAIDRNTLKAVGQTLVGVVYWN